MKPPAFLYDVPRSRAEALALLARHGGAAKLLAGGQSLVPAMNFRLARPDRLIDINRIADLAQITQHQNRLCIGALARHATLEAPVAPGPLGRLLPEIARHIAHAPIRMRGSIGGSLAHADPASEWCCMALALGADIIAEVADRQRIIPAEVFFRSVFATALAENELLSEIRLPLFDDHWQLGFAEFSRRPGDFALAMAVVALHVPKGQVMAARIALGGVAATPVLAPRAAASLVGSTPGTALFVAAAEIAAQDIVFSNDHYGSAEWRRHLLCGVVRRALQRAMPA